MDWETGGGGGNWQVDALWHWTWTVEVEKGWTAEAGRQATSRETGWSQIRCRCS